MNVQPKPTLTEQVAIALGRWGIDPLIAAAKLAPYAEQLTPALIDGAMRSTTWSSNAGGGARLNHLTEWLERHQEAEKAVEKRQAVRIMQAKQWLSSRARAVRKRVRDQGLAQMIDLWVGRLTPENIMYWQRRLAEYLREYGSREALGIVKDRYTNLLDADWLRAIAWDDDRPQKDRSIIEVLNTI